MNPLSPSANTRPWLVSVCAGWQQEISLRKAREMGLQVIGIDADPNASARQLCDIFICHDIWDFAGCIRKVEETKVIPNGAASFISDAGMLTAAHLREYFKLPGLNVSQTLGFTNKIYQRRALVDGGIIGPQWICGGNLSHIQSGLSKLKPPYIIKPADSAGSRGVFKFENTDELKKLFPIAKGFSRSSEVIVEEFIHGTEFSVESITINSETFVLAVSERFKIHETSAREIVSVNVENTIGEKIAQTVKNSLVALGLKDGPSHSEVIADVNGNISVVEIASRGGGFMVCDGLVPDASGFDLSGAIARQSVGWPVAKPLNPAGRSVCLRYVMGRRGFLRNIRGLDAISNKHVWVKPLVALGERIADPVNDGDRIALIKASGSSPEEARSLAYHTEQQISFDIVEEEFGTK